MFSVCHGLSIDNVCPGNVTVGCSRGDSDNHILLLSVLYVSDEFISCTHETLLNEWICGDCLSQFDMFKNQLKLKSCWLTYNDGCCWQNPLTSPLTTVSTEIHLVWSLLIPVHGAFSTYVYTIVIFKSFVPSPSGHACHTIEFMYKEITSLKIGFRMWIVWQGGSKMILIH